MDITQLIGLITKGGPAAIILAVLYGLAMLVREVRAGKVSSDREAGLNARVTALETEMTKVKAALEEAVDALHGMRFQRDQARVRVEYLEQVHGVDPRTTWPPDPEVKGDP